MKRALAVLALVTGVFAATNSLAQAATKHVQVSICAGKDCANTGSQFNFNHSGWVRVETGLPSAVVVKDLTYSCAAFCSHAMYWSHIQLIHGSNGTYVLLDAHYNGTLDANATARSNVYTINIWVHY